MSGQEDVQRLEVGGVPTFFAPMEGPTFLGLRFRVGQSDEPVKSRSPVHSS